MADWKTAKSKSEAQRAAEAAFTKVPASRLSEADEAKAIFDANRERLRSERLAREMTAAEKK